MSQQGVAFLWEEVRQVVLTVWFSISCLEFPYSIFSLEVDGLARKRSLFPDFLYAVTMPMDKNFPYTQPTRRWRVLRCHEFQWYTKTLKVDNYRSLSTVRLHGADPVHDFQENLLYVFEQRIKKYSFIASSPIFKPTVQLSVTEVHSCRFLHFPMLPINLMDQCLMGERKEPEHALAKTLFREISRV